MLEPVSVGLKFGFLAVLYLFLLWVAWSALRDLRRGRAATPQPDRAQYTDATGMYSATDRLIDSDPDGFEPRLLVERAPGHQSGTTYDVSAALRSAAATWRSTSRIRSRPPATPGSSDRDTCW